MAIKKVRNITTNTIYNNVKEAATLTGACATSIRKACRGEYTQAGGYKWEYVIDDTPKKAIDDTPKKVIDNTPKKAIKNTPKNNTPKKAIKQKNDKAKTNNDSSIKVSVTINNKKDINSIITYWCNKIISYDIQFWLNKFIADSKFKNERELDKSLEQLYFDVTSEHPLNNIATQKWQVDIELNTETSLSENINYWATKIILFDTKYWLHKFLLDNKFKNIDDLDSNFKQLYNQVVIFYKEYKFKKSV